MSPKMSEHGHVTFYMFKTIVIIIIILLLL